ncbi:MAG: glycoside hydrolase family 3 protein [Oscillospiraceae bacterium]|nr:glycoside hydrolase family 3 protein [Oscillospiraceae bacterium]MBR2890007.1 glycoside hydrolase family 3 protein [Oscillospiraceae bacterium]
MEMTVRQMLGQKLIFGFHGEHLSEEFKALIREYKIGNVILFLRNVKSAEQLRALCAEIQELILAETGYPAFIVIDQEGGMVTRLPGDAVNVPGAMAIAATGDPENARIASEITIRQLLSLGANFNMAPVLDVNNNPRNPVIGIRSFGDQADRVAQFGVASAQPYPGSGILCCGKHFPGHGDTAVDSHLGLPRVDKTMAEIQALELVPFQAACDAGIPAIMISHVLFPKIVSDGLPSTMSREIITGLLRKKMGYQGLILTDCMEMLAIQDTYGTPEGVLASFKAGVDLAEISSTIGLLWGSAKLVNEAAERGELDLEEMRESVERILAYKQQISRQVQPELGNLEQDRQTARAMSRKAITRISGTAPLADEKTFFCGCADYRASGVGNENSNAGAFAEFMQKAFGGGCAVTSKNPEEAEIRAVAEQAAAYDQIILNTCNGHLFQGQIALAKALAETGKPLTVVAMRNPYDIPLLPECACTIAAYDYSIPALQGLEEVFRGGEMTGICPVAL